MTKKCVRFLGLVIRRKSRSRDEYRTPAWLPGLMVVDEHAGMRMCVSGRTMAAEQSAER